MSQNICDNNNNFEDEYSTSSTMSSSWVEENSEEVQTLSSLADDPDSDYSESDNSDEEGRLCYV